ncbi:asparagine synthetase B [Pontibacter sp. SGAir0037]|uniref:asparagine synthetase B n=1 Tax=Pontibacter sp. SGAir0037 TaxID=2571030 RepID=UPI0010CD138F|nr:asparagine synthetase B [Pontibacter sp. SGAir0037]QCR22064.1 asparagine synthetase B [Pontibacter sp. SGAir0037]
MSKTFLLSIAFFFLLAHVSAAAHLFIAMDQSQKDHLKAYGIAYWMLQQEQEVDWLLNYRGGSFAFQHSEKWERELLVRGVSYSVISEAQYHAILTEIASVEANMEVMKLEKLPRIAVYSPKLKQPWDDAVTLVLTYAEIPYDMLYDEEVLAGGLLKYDWLHLHHDDFTGQYGKFIGRRRNQEWLRSQQQESENVARRFGYTKVSQMKLGVAKKMKEFVAGGGFMFAMCSATDTYDIALAAEGVDIVDAVFDGDGVDPKAQQKLDYSRTFAFRNFAIRLEPYDRGFSDIDNSRWERSLSQENDFFTLFTFSAKWDPIPTMLTQNHEKTVKGFIGQTTAFKKELIKSDVTVMGEAAVVDEARYIHGTLGRGTWTFYGGHDPEDYMHSPGEEPTDLALHPNSPGYRLILNNILFPASKKKKTKT